MKPVIVCIAKLESDYIEEFVEYHLALGFETIYIYDNEDEPTYEKLLKKYGISVVVFHLPGNNYLQGDPGCYRRVGVQYIALYHFIYTYIKTDNDITHIAHIDIDEFIVLKKHNNIKDFIDEYIVGDCAAIGINWRFFGSSGHQQKTNEPVTIRFTKCEEKGNRHIKTLFKKEHFVRYNTCHDVIVNPGYFTKATNGHIISGSFNEDPYENISFNLTTGPYNENIDFSVIQINHYKCKTLEEFKYIRTRGRADVVETTTEDVVASFNMYDKNDIEELTASNFYQQYCLNKGVISPM